MKSRAELADGFRKLAGSIDQTSERIPDVKTFVALCLGERGLVEVPSVSASTLTKMFHSRMKDSFVKAVQTMRHGRDAADMYVAFEEAVDAQQKFYEAQASDACDVKKAS